MNPFEMVIAIVALAMITGIVIKRMELKHSAPSGRDDEEKLRLRREVRDLKERMKVLERIVTDGGVQTASQIEALREHDRVSEESDG